MISKVDLDGLDLYCSFLSGYSGDVTELTNTFLQKATATQDHWQDSHMAEVVAEIMQLKRCIDKFSESCERACRNLRDMIEKYRQYLSGRIGS